VQVDRVLRYASVGIVLPEDILRRLLVELLHLKAMVFAFVG
jgi:hypothetical protein